MSNQFHSAQELLSNFELPNMLIKEKGSTSSYPPVYPNGSNAFTNNLLCSTKHQRQNFEIQPTSNCKMKENLDKVQSQMIASKIPLCLVQDVHGQLHQLVYLLPQNVYHKYINSVKNGENVTLRSHFEESQNKTNVRKTSHEKIDAKDISKTNEGITNACAAIGNSQNNINLSSFNNLYEMPMNAEKKRQPSMDLESVGMIDLNRKRKQEDIPRSAPAPKQSCVFKVEEKKKRVKSTDTAASDVSEADSAWSSFWEEVSTSSIESNFSTNSFSDSLNSAPINDELSCHDIIENCLLDTNAENAATTNENDFLDSEQLDFDLFHHIWL